MIRSTTRPRTLSTRAHALAGGLALLALGCGGSDGSSAPDASSEAAAGTQETATSSNRFPDAAEDAPEASMEEMFGGLGAPQANPHEPPAAPAVPDPETLLVTVDGYEIRQSELEERFQTIVEMQSGGRPLPPQTVQQMRQAYTAQILETLIDEHLLDEAADEAGFEVSEEEYRADFLEQFEVSLAQAGMTRESYEVQLQAARGITYDQFVEEVVQDPLFRRGVRHTLYIASQLPEDVAITDEEVQAQYEEQREAMWTDPATVRASHILVEAEPREEAERILALAREEGADFAALAREHSTCPSGPNGGDLGYFPRTGVMVEPFAAAAFELEVGGDERPRRDPVRAPHHPGHRAQRGRHDPPRGGRADDPHDARSGEGRRRAGEARGRAPRGGRDRLPLIGPDQVR